MQLSSLTPERILRMRWRLTESLLTGLVIRLGIILLLVLGGVVWLVEHTLDEAGDRAQDELLRRQSAEMVAALNYRGGKLRVALPAEMADAYMNREDGYVYLVHDGNGNILAQSDPTASLWVAPALAYRPQSALLLDTRTRDGASQALYMLVQPVRGAKRTLYVIVGQYRTIDDVLLDSAKASLMRDMVLLLGPLFFLALLGVVGLLQEGLGPLRALSREVADVGGKLQGGGYARISTDNVPREIRPVVEAFNTVLAELGRSLAAQQALTADTAHQLKTPLAVLRARLEQMDDFKGRPEIERDVQRMDRLVRQLLHYAVLSQHPATLRPTDLTATVRDVVSAMFPLARQAKVELTFDAPDDAVMVHGDVLQIGEAVQNLIDNAIRHSPPGARVDVVLDEDGTLEVKDRGPGIPLGEQALVFTRFWQGPDGESAHGGAGLGLAVVAEIMRQHGGHAKAESRDAGGSVFSLSFRTV